jgi:inner membrane protein
MKGDTVDENASQQPAQPTVKTGRRWGDWTAVKLAMLALLVLVLLIPVVRVTGLIRERMGRQAEVAAEIAETWGGSQTLLGPILAIPHTVTVEQVTVEERDGVRGAANRSVQRTEKVEHHVLHALPEEVSWQARIEPEIRYRGLFEVVVYEARLTVAGVFERPSIEPRAGDRVLWDQAALVLGVPDVRGLQHRAGLRWGDREVEFLPGAGPGEVVGSGIHAPLPDWGDAEPGERVPFSFELVLRGSRELSFLPAGEETRVEMSSPWPSPGFGGAFLPAVREIGPDGFTASWRVPYFGRGYGQTWSDQTVTCGQLAASAFGVSLVLPADAYHQTERSVKYAVLFILLTFGTFFLLELLSPRRLHAMHYLLIGFALCVFYVLLLALGEHLGFTAAYVLAAAATAGLIAGYARTILASRGRAAVVLGALAGLYGFLYVLLRLEDYALLLGAAGLFAALALLMGVTRHLDWSSLTFRRPEPSGSA